MSQNQKKIYVSNPDVEIFIRLEEILKKNGKTFSGWIAEEARLLVKANSHPEVVKPQRRCNNAIVKGRECQVEICPQLSRMLDYGLEARKKEYARFRERCIFADDASLT